MTTTLLAQRRQPLPASAALVDCLAELLPELDVDASWLAAHDPAQWVAADEFVGPHPDPGEVPDPVFADWAGMPPGPTVCARLAAADIQLTRLSETELIDVVRSARQLASWSEGLELTAAAAFFAAATAQAADAALLQSSSEAWDAHCTAVQAELAAALHVTSGTASWLVDTGAMLTQVLPDTLNALRQGQIDMAKALVIVNGTAILDTDEQRRQVEGKVLADAATLTSEQLRRRVSREVLNVDPAAAERRRKSAEKQARLWVKLNAVGTATLSLVDLPQVLALAAAYHVEALAKELRAAGDGRTLEDLKIAIAVTLLTGQDPRQIPLMPITDPDDRGPDGPLPDPPGDPDDRGPDGEPGSECGGVPANGDIDEDHDLDDDADAQTGRSPHDRASGGGPGGGDADKGSAQAERGEAEPGGGRKPPPAPTPQPVSGFSGEDGVPWPTGPMGGVRPADDDGEPDPGPERRVIAAGPPKRSRYRLLTLVVPLATLAGTADRAGYITGFGYVTAMIARRLAVIGRRWHVSFDRRGVPVLHAQVHPADMIGARPDPAALATLLREKLEPLTGQACAANVHPVADHYALGLTQGPYTPGAALARAIRARDLTCTYPGCIRSRVDLDHVIPYDQHGPTCDCDLCALCRGHHRAKQTRRITLVMPIPGRLIWHTRTGIYLVTTPTDIV